MIVYQYIYLVKTTQWQNSSLERKSGIFGVLDFGKKSPY
nr:MAG TPA: hypothetical protein [Bacteriophage sp.]